MYWCTTENRIRNALTNCDHFEIMNLVGNNQFLTSMNIQMSLLCHHLTILQLNSHFNSPDKNLFLNVPYITYQT